jgi:inward rectifier potassium channel
VNHVINENSPLYGLVKEDLEGIDAEFLILLKGFDTAYAQIVQSLYSYRFPDIVWGAKFTKIYDRSKSGKMRVKLDSINDYDRAELNTPAAGNFS